jgi:hypothetical protein
MTSFFEELRAKRGLIIDPSTLDAIVDDVLLQQEFG